MSKNTSIKIAIIDDDDDFLSTMEYFVKKIGIEEIVTANSFISAKELIDKERPDIVLLDIDLGTFQSGIDIGVHIRKTTPNTQIIYFTNNYNDEIFDLVKGVQPNAFLDKELNELKVRQAIELAIVEQAQANLGQSVLDVIFVKIGSIYKKIELKDIDYVYYADRYANIQSENKSYPVNLTMKDLSKKLPSSHFIQIHQSYIINLTKIQQISMNNSQVEINGKWLPIGVSFRKTFYEKVMLLH